METVRARLRTLRRISFVVGVLLVMIAMMFFWIGFAVPDWLELKMSSQEAVERKFGLWLVCSINTRGSVLTCKYWTSSAELFPDFLKTTQVLITLGCIMGTFSFGFGLAAFFLYDRIKISIQLAASLTSLISALFLTIGLAAFGGDFSSYAVNLGAVHYRRRWGYWVMVPAIVLLVPASVFLIVNVFSGICSNREEDESRSRKKRPNQNSMNRMMTSPPRPPTPNSTGVLMDTRSTIIGERSNHQQQQSSDPSVIMNRLASNSVFDMNYPGRGGRLTASQQPAFRYGYYASTDTDSSGGESGSVTAATTSTASNHNNNNSSTSSCNSPAQNCRYYPYRQANDYDMNGYRSGGHHNIAFAEFGGAAANARSVVRSAENGVVEIVQGVQQNFSSQKSNETKMFWARIKNFKYFYDR